MNGLPWYLRPFLGLVSMNDTFPRPLSRSRARSHGSLALAFKIVR